MRLRLCVLPALGALASLGAAPRRAPAQPADSVRSTLRVVDVGTGRVETVYAERRHLEAPNWSRDGRSFVVNSGGRLYRLPVRGAAGLEEIPTGGAARINNDHGLSPDGRRLAFSHAEPAPGTPPGEAWLASRVYVVPAAGVAPNGQPNGSLAAAPATPLAPSFWHGWSPDGRTLAYVGRRGGEWDVYTAPAAGGPERRVTTCPGLDDGPDYAPDGAWIYYNSMCGGTMQIWRVRPDGTGAEQLTRDAYANWFPHPSPDGRWVAYLAYLEDQGDRHPFGRRVKLRLMDRRDGRVRDLTAPFFGGQGTLNVPSWSPDGRRLAFVTYAVGGASDSLPGLAPAPTGSPNGVPNEPPNAPVAARPGGRTLAERLGHPPGAKLLILHADDLGVAHAVDSASLAALERGAVSSASVMMPTPWVAEVAAWARAHPGHDLGLHLTLTSEWRDYRWGSVAPASLVPSLLDSAGTFPSDTRPVAEHAAVAEVERELRAQVARALAVGIRPTHLDSHMGALFTTPTLYAAFARVAREHGLPFLAARLPNGQLPAGVDLARDVVLDTVIVAGPDVPPARWPAFYADAVRALRPGLSEIIVHLGRDDAELRAVTAGHDAYGAAWRQRDADVVQSAAFQRALRESGVVLVRWRDVQRAAGG